MKNIILIGDSIRMGYDNYVTERLAGVANVFSMNCNAKFAENVLRFLGDWRHDYHWPNGEDVDIVHWNAGLWDCARLFGDEPLTPKDAYENFIRRVDLRIRLFFPNAKVIFATSTSVNESAYKKNFLRYNRDIEEYNGIALRVLAGTDTVINDLYSVSAGCSPECRSDATHFYTEQGTALIGGQVLKVLMNELGLSEKDLRQVKADAPTVDEKKRGM